MDILVMVRSAPTPDPEALELILALAAFELPPKVIFEGAGMGWLLKDAQALHLGGKSPAKLVKSLPLFDCDQVYYLDQDAIQGVIDATQLTPSATPATREQIRQWIASADHCLSF
ncbi:hypothetical protein CHH28_14355 [Bacterioplanes sanyensis]|uniref:Uncharacterized protein n=1 Tax=Bacterioplanes sanyensis TaxID=1249553 RepID=A0A222FM85_9GAMM|nr:DsrE family protein [Bacterioplanes sanyensis]ASP39782.1 hypothetical protein CHH28_14355 [Bacterioplanes sanyensis]